MTRQRSTQAGPVPPIDSLPLRDALARSAPLAGLLQRLGESRRRFDDIAALLPHGLRGSVQPGPLDDEGWTLVCAHGAAGAKLRQMLPLLAATLQARGWKECAIRVRIEAQG